MTQGRGSAQGPKSPTIDPVNPQRVTVIIYLHSLSLANMQKKKQKKKVRDKEKRRRERGSCAEEKEEQRHFLFHMKTRILCSTCYIILFHNFSQSYCFELQRTFCQEREGDESKIHLKKFCAGRGECTSGGTNICKSSISLSNY